MGKSPKKRRSRVNRESTPTKTLPKRVKGQTMAYLLALEKGGSKRNLAQIKTDDDGVMIERKSNSSDLYESFADKHSKLPKQQSKLSSPLLKEPFKEGISVTSLKLV